MSSNGHEDAPVDTPREQPLTAEEGGATETSNKDTANETEGSKSTPEQTQDTKDALPSGSDAVSAAADDVPVAAVEQDADDLEKQQDTPADPTGVSEQPVDEATSTTVTSTTLEPPSSPRPAPAELPGNDSTSSAPPSASTIPATSEADAPSTESNAPISAALQTTASTDSSANADGKSANGPAAASSPAASTASGSSSLKAPLPKKFTSSLSMNKKFLEKSGVDSKSPQPTSSLLPKAGSSPARSPALASPSVPTHPGTSASPPIVAGSTAPGTSHPRLLTGKLSSLGSGSGSGGVTSSASATWGRPSLAGKAPSSGSTAFGKSGFVPAPGVGTSQPGQGSAGPQSLGRMRGFAFGRPGGPGGQAPWQEAARAGRAGFAAGPAGGFSRPPTDSDFPSFQEAARAEEQRKNAVLAKEKAEEMAAAAQAAYNERVLEGLKSFSGEYTNSSATHWDELDDDDDDLGDVLEFADGTRYEVPQSATMPTEAESAAFQHAAAASDQAAAMHAKYEESLAREKGLEPAAEDATQVKRSERFVDDFDRGEKAGRGPERAPAGQAGQTQAGRTLFNDRLGRFEPYAGRPQKGRPERQTSPPAMLQRQQRSISHVAEAGKPPTSSRTVHFPPSVTANAPVKTSTPSAPTAPAGKVAHEQPAPARKESPWAKLPAVPKEPIPTGPAPSSSQQQPSKPSPTAAAPVTAPQRAPTPDFEPASPLLSAAEPPQAAQTQPVQAPAAPAEDPEEAYRKRMRAIADQARKRREEEEAEREAQKERARKKAAEIEEKMKSLQKESAPLPPPKPTQPTILSPPASRPDRSTNWRRTSVSETKQPETRQPPVAPKTVLKPQSPPAQLRAYAPPATKTASAVSKPAPPVSTERKQPPSSAAFEALAEFASVSLRKPPTAESLQEPAVQKSESVLPSLQPQPGPSKSLHVAEELASPTTLAPRVRLGRRIPSYDASSSGTSEAQGAHGVPHAFPRPTILIGQTGLDTDVKEGGQPLSALEKIMLQVKAAQVDLKAKQEAEAMIEEERKKMQLTRSQGEFDDALSRISRALDQAAKTSKDKGKGKEVFPRVHMRVTLVSEPFEQSSTERPPSPRSWKTFSVKMPPAGKRAPGPHIPIGRLKQFSDVYSPRPIYSSTWIQPRGVQLPKDITLEDYLIGPRDFGAPPRVKVSKFYLPSTAALLPPNDDPPPTEGVVRVRATELAQQQGGDADITMWRRGSLVEVKTETLTVIDPPDGHAPLSDMDMDIDFACLSLSDDEDAPKVIKVSLPKTHAIPPVSTANYASQPEASSPEMGRFRTYGPKLPENSTVAFRRGISPAKASDPAEPASGKHMFMVNSELNGAREAPGQQQQQGYTRSHDQQVMDEITAASRAHTNRETARAEFRPSPTAGEPVFPSLANVGLPSARTLGDRDAASSPASSQQNVGYTGMRRHELPNYVIEELERLNATVSTAPLSVPPRLDSPGTLAGRSVSPWAVANGKASMMPSALSLSAIDPSMSVWSKPTEETAAAAAAAFNSASKDSHSDSVQENSLKDLVDDYPSSMPSNAMELPISDGERPQSKDSDVRGPPSSSHHQQQRTRSAYERSPRNRHMSISQVMNSTSPPSGPAGMSVNGRSRYATSAAPRQSNFAFSPAAGQHGATGYESNPYAGMQGYVAYSTHHPQQQHHGAMYSPAMAHAQAPGYGGFVSAAPGYQSGYSPSTNGMTMMSPAYSSISGAAGQDGRPMSGHATSLWMPASSVQTSMMNGGSYSSGSGISPYASAGQQSYMTSGSAGGAGSGKTRVHTSPMYPGQQQQTQQQQRGESGATGYPNYGYAGSATNAAHSPGFQYSSFSPQLASPAPGQGGYPAHLRSTSAQQYGGRRQGW